MDDVQAKRFAIIQFTSSDGGSVSIVNSQWLTPRKCEVYWPPIKGSKAFEKMLHLNTSPTESWKLYGVQRVFCETENLNEAKRKLKLSEFTSDLDTAEEETSKKRPTKRTKRYISGSESENEDTHARPPPVKKTFLSRLSMKDTTDRQVEETSRQDQQKSLLAPENVTNYVLNEHLTSLNNIENLPLLSSSVLQGFEHELGQTNLTTWLEGTPHRRTERNYGSVIKSTSSPSCSTALTGLEFEHELGQTNLSTWLEGTPHRKTERNYGSVIKSASSPSCSTALKGLEHELGPVNSSTWLEGTPHRRTERNYGSVIKSTSSPSRSTALTEFQSQVLSLLTTIKTQNEQVLEIIKQNRNIATGTLKSEFKFPLNNAEELIANEILLKNKDNYDNLVLYLKSHGGRDVSGKVPRALKFCMSDELASEFNFYGKKTKTTNKKAFCTLRLRDCIVESVVSTTGNATAKEVEDCVKIWLKHAPERVKKNKK